mmetsp:Transcript_36275/g.112251  ORF Transcript_36275/g.112251 Transcript_36275/m.112251 type:complete len:267 (+) Transcript_36275:930-1730(+)
MRRRGLALCAFAVRRASGVAAGSRKNAPAQAQGTWEPVNRDGARPRVRVVDRTRALEDYDDCTALQKELVDANLNGQGDSLVLVEHAPVYTLGRGATREHVLFDPDAAGAPRLVRAERGGDVTYHGPGQLVAYPILDLTRFRRDSHWYLRALEEVAIRTCATLGADGATRSEDHTGVWLDGRKVAAAGVALRRWVTYHGISLNLDPDAAAYDSIVPCGLDPVHEPVGALSARLGRVLTPREAAPAFLEAFADVFEAEIVVDAKDLP